MNVSAPCPILKSLRKLLVDVGETHGWHDSALVHLSGNNRFLHCGLGEVVMDGAVEYLTLLDSLMWSSGHVRHAGHEVEVS